MKAFACLGRKVYYRIMDSSFDYHNNHDVNLKQKHPESNQYKPGLRGMVVLMSTGFGLIRYFAPANDLNRRSLLRKAG